ncbi:MAG: glycosyltransferase family 2 protein [Candidatus Magasanikbacteria bacterium]
MFIALVPAYNEEKRIRGVIEGLKPHVDMIVVLDDCSKDNTEGIAREAGAKVIRHHINRGQGASLQTGHEYAQKIGADYVLHFDGDGQFDPHDIRPALEHLEKEKADILFGSRFLDSRSNVPFLKRYILLPLSRRVNSVFGLGLSDVHNGFRILHKNAFSNMHIEQDRMAHATEIEMETKRLDLKYTEFPVKVIYHEYGQGIRGGVAILKDLLLQKFIK